MEIIDGDRQPEKPEIRRDSTLAGNIYLGVILIAIGLLWLFFNIHWISYGVFSFLFSWPMLMVAVGGYLLAIRRRNAGFIVGGLGVVFLVLTNLPISLSFGKIVLPILLVASGLSIILSRTGRA